MSLDTSCLVALLLKYIASQFNYLFVPLTVRYSNFSLPLSSIYIKNP